MQIACGGTDPFVYQGLKKASGAGMHREGEAL